MPEWQTEWALKTPSFLRFSATAMGANLQTICPANAALGVRPGTVFIGGEKFKPPRRSPFESFPLGLVRDGYLQVLQARPDLGDPARRDELAAAAVHSCIDRVSSKIKVPREMRTWVVGGVQNLLETVDAAWVSADYLEFQFEQVDELVAFDSVQGGDVDSVEWTIWGGVFTTPDGAVRQLQSLCLSNAGNKKLTPARLATAARVLADGLSTHRPSGWGAPYVPSPKQLGPAQRVIVEMIGVNDGSRAVLFDDTAEVARALFANEARPKAELIGIGGLPRSTRRCLSCQASGVCDQPPRRPGLLGVEGIAAWPRVLTPSALTTYRTCPHLSYLKDVLGLSAPQLEPSPAQRRGQLVHAWLAHSHVNRINFESAKLPETGQDVIAAALGWAEHDYQDVRPWLESHIAAQSELDVKSQSPNGEPGKILTLAEFELVIKDTDADVLVTTRPDLLYASGRVITWRETKTLAAPAVNQADDFFVIYPQIPLAICVLADHGLSDEVMGLLGVTDPSGQRQASHARFVELELLWPGGHRVLKWAASDEVIVAKARMALAQMTDSWLFDQNWQPPENPPCRWCSLAKICEFADAGKHSDEALPEFDPTTGEIKNLALAEVNLNSVARALGIIATFSETDREEEVEF